MTMFKQSTFAASLALMGVGITPALAADSAHSLSANVGLYSQYVFRGLAQTNEEPAIQGGFDYAHKSGVYLGVWGSNISWLKENNSNATSISGSYKSGGSLELDFYGGYKGSVGDFGYDVGLLQYYYPGDVNAGFFKANTLEGYVAGSWKWFTVKYSHALSNKVFGVRDARGTYYLDLSASFPLGDSGFTLGAHYGIQKYTGRDPGLNANIDNNAAYSYDDWKISMTYDMSKVSKAFAGMTAGVAYTDTSSATCQGYGKFTETCTVNGVAGQTGVFPENVADGKATVWISKSF